MGLPPVEGSLKANTLISLNLESSFISSFRVCGIPSSLRKSKTQSINELKEFFENQSIRTIQLSPDEHDKMAASSQGITHFIGRVLNEAGVVSTQINTLGFNDLLAVIEQTCNDSWDLFQDLQKYNPYTSEMIYNLIGEISKLHKQIKANED